MVRKKTNLKLEGLIKDLKLASHEYSAPIWNAPIWKDVATRLSRSRKLTAEVNLSRLNRVGNDGDFIIVPGKVLGSGALEKKLNIATFEASGSAKTKIEEAGGRLMTIGDLVAENPKGTAVRIVE
jgi:large subunit ribosomal protein L18e